MDAITRKTMKLHILDSGSSGNCYILESKSGDILMIDAGVHFSKIQKAINFKYNKVVACLLTHEHGDHSKSVLNLIDKCIPVCAPEKCAIELGFSGSNYYHEAIDTIRTSYSGFNYCAFPLTHDVPTVGYVISHPECGQIVFATDTSKLNYLFPDTNHYIIEANYCQYVLADRKMRGIGNAYVSDRVERSHLSIQQALHCLEINNLDNVHTITLIHLSNANSDEGSFRDQVVAKTGKRCYIAKKNMTVDLSLNW